MATSARARTGITPPSPAPDVTDAGWPDGRGRCFWVPRRPDDDSYVRYHDDEWGVPVHDDRLFFEMLTLEGAQAGLSWETVLRRREGYRAAFDNFDVERVAAYTPADVERLLGDARIIRNRAKVESTVTNARAFLSLQAAEGSFDAYVWRFVDGKPIVMAADSPPAQTKESAALSKELSKRGFRFVGPTICYAFMQGCGLVNDHVEGCFRRDEVMTLSV